MVRRRVEPSAVITDDQHVALSGGCCAHDHMVDARMLVSICQCLAGCSEENIGDRRGRLRGEFRSEKFYMQALRSEPPHQALKPVTEPGPFLIICQQCAS